MAPDNRTHEGIDTELRQLVQILYQVIIQISGHEGEKTTKALENELYAPFPFP
jgi:hypothetical protein